MRARTDLWEPGASNRLGPPGLSPSSAWARHFSRLTSKSRTLPRNACNSTFATPLFAFHLSRLASKEFTSTRGRVSNSRYTLSPNPVSISNLPVRSCAINHSPKSNLHMSQIKRSTPTFLLPTIVLQNCWISTRSLNGVGVSDRGWPYLVCRSLRPAAVPISAIQISRHDIANDQIPKTGAAPSTRPQYSQPVLAAKARAIARSNGLKG